MTNRRINVGIVLLIIISLVFTIVIGLAITRLSNSLTAVNLLDAQRVALLDLGRSLSLQLHALEARPLDQVKLLNANNVLLEVLPLKQLETLDTLNPESGRLTRDALNV
jgi:hypothetical protein